MENRAKKLLMLGLDAALPELITRFAEEGLMPNLKSLMEGGLFSRVMTTFPPPHRRCVGGDHHRGGPGDRRHTQPHGP